LTVLLDASAIVPLFVEQRWSAAATTFVAAQSRPWVVSDFAAGETLAAMSLHTRTGELTLSAAQAARLDFDDWRFSRVQLEPCLATDVRTAVHYVARFELALRMPDAIHLAIAQRFKIPLATFDKRLARAAVAIGVEVIEFAAI
jgi:uncharacterized protein